MTLQGWGSIGELVGGVAIIVSLLYVGLQIRQGTKATQAATNQAFSAQYSEQILQITREDMRDIFRLGLGGLQDLGELFAQPDIPGLACFAWANFGLTNDKKAIATLTNGDYLAARQLIFQLS